jgi:predicted DNA-binding transcriptional regulator AlpA
MDEDQAELWGTEETASFLRVPKATLYQWRYRSYGPLGRRVGRYVRYDPREVRAWFAAQKERPNPVSTSR